MLVAAKTKRWGYAAQGTPSLEELKLIYYRSFIRYHSHHNNYLEICRCYRAIYESESIAADEAKWQPVSLPLL